MASRRILLGGLKLRNTYYIQYNTATFKVVGISYLRTFDGTLPNGLVKISDLTSDTASFSSDYSNLDKYINLSEKRLYDGYNAETGEFFNNP